MAKIIQVVASLVLTLFGGKLYWQSYQQPAVVFRDVVVTEEAGETSVYRCGERIGVLDDPRLTVSFAAAGEQIFLLTFSEYESSATLYEIVPTGLAVRHRFENAQGEWLIAAGAEALYIIGGVYNEGSTDIYLGKFAFSGAKISSRLVGGAGIESPMQLALGDGVYILGWKAPGASAVFGNGGHPDGGVFLARFSDSLQLEQFITITDARAHDLAVTEEAVYLAADSGIYVLKPDLAPLHKLEAELAGGYFLGPEKFIGAAADKITLYDLHSLTVEATLARDSERSYARNVGRFWYLTDQTAVTAGETATFRKIIAPPAYEEELFGRYELQRDFGVVIFPDEVEIPLACTVSQGFIYPEGYKLLFNGTALLNGKPVYQNTALPPGAHELILQGFNTEVTLRFEVSARQHKFKEKFYVSCAEQAPAGTVCEVSFLLPSSEQVTALASSAASFRQEDALLHVSFAPLAVGSNELWIKSAELASGRHLALEYRRAVWGLSALPLLVSRLHDTKSAVDFHFELTDPEGVLRHLVVSSDQGKVERLPLASGKIVLPAAGLYTVYLASDLGAGEESWQELATLETKGRLAFEVTNQEAGASLEKLKLSVGKGGNLAALRQNGKLLMEVPRSSRWPLVVAIVCAFALVGTIIGVAERCRKN